MVVNKKSVLNMTNIKKINIAKWWFIWQHWCKTMQMPKFWRSNLEKQRSKLCLPPRKKSKYHWQFAFLIHTFGKNFDCDKYENMQSLMDPKKYLK